MKKDNIVECHRRNLPHYQLKSSIISLSWRLAFTLPKAKLAQLAQQKETISRLSNNAYNKQVDFTEQLDKLYRFDEFLGSFDHAGLSLTTPGIGDMLGKAFEFYDPELYDLHAYCLMPNHIHLLVKPSCDSEDDYTHVSTIVQRLKGYTAKQINKYLESSGKVWNEDYYDRYIRSIEDYYGTVEYILNNPVKAGLVKKAEDWRYSCFRKGLVP